MLCSDEKVAEALAELQRFADYLLPYAILPTYHDRQCLLSLTSCVLSSIAELVRVDPRTLYSTLDSLNARFGKQAVYFASAHKARDRGGLHIAFNHIPDPKTDK